MIDETSVDTDRWMVWYVDDQLEPVGVKAPDRKSAASIGKKARNAAVAAVVGENEGAADDLDGLRDDELSTEANPRRYIQTTLSETDVEDDDRGTRTDGGQPSSDTDGDTITVHVWQGSQRTTYDALLSEDPDMYEVPPDDPVVLEALDDDDRVLLAEEIDHHGTYAFNVPNECRPATVNVHTNDRYHDPTDWGNPIEQGLTFHQPDDHEPFQCELWGRVMLWVERPDSWSGDSDSDSQGGEPE